MPTDIRAQFRHEFERARDEYIAAINAHAGTLVEALTTCAGQIDGEYELASRNLARKHEAYRAATENLRDLSSIR